MLNLKIGKTNLRPPASDTTVDPFLRKMSEPFTATESPPDFSTPSETSSSGNPPDHFDDLINNPPAAPAPASNLIGRDDFHKLFIGGFSVGSAFTKLQSLKVPAEDPGARECAYAIYDSIYEIPALHFMITPGGKWFQRMFAIGMFSLPLAQAVKAELAERRRPKPAPGKPMNFTQAKAAPSAEGEPDAMQAAALGA